MFVCSLQDVESGISIPTVEATTVIDQTAVVDPNVVVTHRQNVGEKLLDVSNHHPHVKLHTHLIACFGFPIKTTESM